MNARIWIILLIAASVGFSAAIAQTTATPGVTKRQVRQQERIKEGVKSGELTRRETRQLERQHAKIQVDKKVAKSDGVVTPAERQKLQKEQNRANRNIYRKKHNNRTR